MIIEIIVPHYLYWSSVNVDVLTIYTNTEKRVCTCMSINRGKNLFNITFEFETLCDSHRCKFQTLFFTTVCVSI